MSGKGEGKKELKGAKVYIHIKGKSNARITHIDVEHPALNRVIMPKQATYAAGKQGGFFVGLKKEMIAKAEKEYKKKTKKM